MSKKIKYVLDLDTEEFLVKFTDSEGRKRTFRVVTSEGLIEYRDARGREYLRLVLEEVR